MANYYGVQTVDVSSYDNFKNAILGNGYDVDYVGGAQCVDIFKLLNYNLGYPSPYTKTGSNGYASECWTNTSSRSWNAGTDYTLIYNISDLEKGDMVIMDGTSSSPAGHNALCDADYGTYSGYIPMLGQNQGGAPFPTGGAVTNIYNWDLTNFLGAFRLNAWHSTPPTPPSSGGHGSGGGGTFPWVLYANKLRRKY